jgi:hypothetical protein
MPDERQRGALGAVCPFAGQFHQERGREQGQRCPVA